MKRHNHNKEAGRSVNNKQKQQLTPSVLLPNFPYPVIASITDPVRPVERGRKYAIPLADALEARGLGTVTGGGGYYFNGEAQGAVDVDLELLDLEGALAFARECLRDLGAPSGSVLGYEKEGQQITLPIV